MPQGLKYFNNILEETGLKRLVDFYFDGSIGLDDNSRTPSGYQIQVTPKFIKQLNDAVKSLSNDKFRKQLVRVIKFLFTNCPANGYLTPEKGYEGPNGREVRVGRAGDEVWRSIQSYPQNGVIVLNGFFKHDMSTTAESRLFAALDKELNDVEIAPKEVEDDSSELDLSNLSDNEIDVINKCKHMKSPKEVKSIIKYYKETRRPEIISELEAAGFNEFDIADELEHELYHIFTESYHPVKITEALLKEANRQQLLQKSRNAQEYSPKNRLKGKNRYDRRTKSSISATVRDYNMIQMDPLFKRDILEFKIPVMGETDVYTVDVRVDGLLAEIRKQIMANKGTLEFKVILQSLMKVLNMGNVYIGCNCLHPDTRIKLLDGTTPTVKEMCERFEAGETLWVYSTDEHGDFKPGHVERVWKTGECTDFIKITLDNGEEIITTPEHPYMLRDGTYAFACDLKEGQSLMPMYFNYHNDYEQVKLNTETRGWRSIYKLVAEALKSEEIQEALTRVNPDDNMPYDIAIHHKDFNKHNNNPDNLDIMTAREHWDYHASLTWENKPEEMKQHIIETSRENAVKRNANPTDNMIKSRKEWQEKGRLRNYDEDRKQQQSDIAKQYLVPNRHEFTPEESSKYSKDAWERGCFNTDKFHEARVREGKRLFNDKDNQLHMRKAKMLKVLQQMLDSGVELTEENYNKYRLKIKASKAEDVFGSFNNMISEFQLNHKIVKVERVVLESTPVYDIKVKEWENFVVDAGVVLHNCPDAKYRMAYQQTKNDYKAGYKETRPSDITNPNDTLGAGCKHVLLILSNLDWAVKVASVINNYIKYCKEHLQRNYADYIFPKIYGVKYDKAVQLQLFDNGLFPEDIETMNTVIDQGFRGKDRQGKFVKNNEFRFQKSNNEPEQEEDNPLGLEVPPSSPTNDSAESEEQQ